RIGTRRRDGAAGDRGLVERCAVFASRKREGHTMGAARAQPDEAPRPDEEPQDVVRVIRERVGGIVAPGDDPPMSATVRLDAAPNELLRILLHDAPLPGLEDDRPLVLASSAVLREQRGRRVRVGIDDRDGLTATKPNGMARTQRRDRARDSLDDRALTFV